MKFRMLSETVIAGHTINSNASSLVLIACQRRRREQRHGEPADASAEASAGRDAGPGAGGNFIKKRFESQTSLPDEDSLLNQNLAEPEQYAHSRHGSAMSMQGHGVDPVTQAVTVAD